MTSLDLAFERRGARTVLTRRLFRWPFVVMRPFHLDRAPAHMATVIVQSSSGALQRGDRLAQAIEVGPQAAAHVTTQGAAPVHEAGEQGAEETVALKVGGAACLEYLPEPRVLFPMSALASTLELDCAADGIALIGDAFSWHDPAGADRRPRRLRSSLSVRIGAAGTVAVDSLDLDAFSAAPAPFRAFGALTVVAPAHGTSWAEGLTLALGGVEGLYSAASALPGGAGVGVRMAGRDLRALRAGLAMAWGWARKALFGEEPGRRRKD